MGEPPPSRMCPDPSRARVLLVSPTLSTFPPDHALCHYSVHELLVVRHSRLILTADGFVLLTLGGEWGATIRRYTKVAEVIRDIFREYDPRMRSYSLDEAYLNVTPTLASRLDEEDGLPRQTGQKSTSVSLATAVATQSSAQAVDAHSAEGRLPHQQPCPTPPGALFATPPPPSFSSSSSSFSLSLSPSSLAPATESDCGRGSPVGEGRSQRKNGCWASEDKQQEWASWQRQQQRQRQRRRTQSDLGNRETDEDEEDGDEEDRGGGSSSSSSSNSGGSGIKRGDERRRARMFEAAQAMAEEIRRRIQEATRLTASVGIGPNFMLAKVRY